MLKRLICLSFLAALEFVVAAPLAHAVELSIPNYWDDKERLPKPDLSGVERVRFLTTIDFPPFNYLDADNRLTGFNVELVRAICQELDIVNRCQIQALPWEELDGAIDAGQAEALIAGTSITAAARERYAFSRPYLRFPARFAASKSTQLPEPIHRAIAGKRIGVITGSVHEEMLRAYFPTARPVTISQSNWLYDNLRDGKIDGIFGDGMRLSFWLAGPESQDCCELKGGPYNAPEFLGAGLAIAVPHDNAGLTQAFDYALREISVKGIFAELYLKHFPISFY